jgi:hypothetical protein
VEVSEVRRRLLAALEKARHAAAERRARTDAAARDYDLFLGQRAAPIFHQFAAALNAEGHAFTVFTPAASIRLASERSPEKFIELVLDDTSDPPAVVGRTTRGRGRRMISSERAIGGGAPVADLTEEDVLTFLLEEIVELLER